MNMQSKLFFLAVLIVVLLLSVYKYNQIVVNKNYIIYTTTTCNPSIESCFISDCDVTDPECHKEPYKKIEKKASNVENCYGEDFCPELSCGLSEKDCRITLCSKENKAPEEICSFPEILEFDATETTSTDQSDVVSESIIN